MANKENFDLLLSQFQTQVEELMKDVVAFVDARKDFLKDETNWKTPIPMAKNPKLWDLTVSYAKLIKRFLEAMANAEKMGLTLGDATFGEIVEILGLLTIEGRLICELLGLKLDIKDD